MNAGRAQSMSECVPEIVHTEEFYKLRSMFAHGEAQRLSWDDTVLYGEAIGYFNRALEHEVLGGDD